MISTLKKMIATTVGAMAFVSAAAHAATGEFTVKNQNGTYSIQRVWTAAADTNEVWKETYLNYAIAPNSKSRFTISNTNRCLFDLKVQFSDGYVQTFADVNICRGDSALAT